MKLTKYEHSCLVIEEQGAKLVIDPGVYSKSFNDFANISVLIITHTHLDHKSPENIQKIVATNPAIRIFTVPEVASEINDNAHVTAAKAGDVQKVEPFKIEIFGGQHAIIHPSVPVAQNIGVLINNEFYYPGDSIIEPKKPVKILALPVSAPWLKTAEVMDFLTALKPERAFATHDALFSDIGHEINSIWMQRVTDATGTTYQILKVGESLEI